MDKLRKEQTDYYSQWHIARMGQMPAEGKAVRTGILSAMDDFARANPECHPSLLKAKMHEEMAERFEPVIFRHSPFFFEMGLRYSENWGNPYSREYVVGSWLMHHQRHLIEDKPEIKHIAAFQMRNEDCPIGMWGIWGGFDVDHHCLGYSKLLLVGVNGILGEIEQRRLQPCSEHQSANLEAMERSCRAIIRIATRFGLKARAMLADEVDPQARKFLSLIIVATEHIPANPPRTFYEGLAMLWFLREVTASMEAIGVSVIGHPDRQLYELYKSDLASGRLTEAEARDLLARWMLPTDIKFHVEDSAWPETSTCMELGGCDEDGNTVWNELTRMIIEVHHEHHLINPKLNCRISGQSPSEYLDLMSATINAGHNNFALINDDVLIPSFVSAGKTEREARLYVNGGCQEPMVEGVEHSAGAYYYFDMSRVLDLCMQPLGELTNSLSEVVASRVPSVIENANTFEDFYTSFMKTLVETIRTGAEWASELGKDHWQMHPCPFFSTTLTGCIDTATDYTQGGAKYNPSGLALVGMGTVVDSLYAVKVAVYDEAWTSLAQLREALARNWEGYDDLRQRILRLPKYGQGHAEMDALSARFAKDISREVGTIPSERGGRFQASCFVYYAFEWFAEYVRATPNGRKAGELLTQGVCPDRNTPNLGLTDVFHTLSHIDFKDFPGNAVLDVQLPAGGAIPVDALSATIRTFAKLGGPTLQLNCVSVDDMKDAQIHPDRHRDLVVRISGLSAHFVCLEKHVQDEIIGRSIMDN